MENRWSKGIQKLVDVLFAVCMTLFLLVALYVLALVFLYATFRIPSRSMYPVLEEGDRVLVWKPILGARLFDVGKSLDGEQTKIYRLPGLRKVKRNDVLVFNFPHPDSWSRIEMHILKYYIKRCIALPGDTLSIRDGMFRVSGVDGPLGNADFPVRLPDRLEHPEFRASLHSPQGRGGDAGPAGRAAVQETDRVGAGQEAGVQERQCPAGRQPGAYLPFPEELLLRGGRQRLELAGLPLLGAAAGGVHRGPCRQDM